MSDLDTEQDVESRYAAPGDSERFAHYFWHPEPGVAETMILQSRVEGTPLTALCGRRLRPQRDPARFPVCPECAEIKTSALRGSPADG